MDGNSSVFSPSRGELVNMSVDVKEDPRHPSRFFLEVGGETLMEIAVVGTDYTNWAVIWAKSGSACKSQFPMPAT